MAYACRNGRWIGPRYFDPSTYQLRVLESVAMSIWPSDRWFRFDKRSQLLIRAHNETLSVAAMCVSNEDRLPIRIHGWDAAPTPTGFAEFFSDEFPVIHAARPVPIFASVQVASLAPAGAVDEFCRYADGESSQKPFRICHGRCFRCVPDATSVKSGNPSQQARRSNRAVSLPVVAIRDRFFWPSPATKFQSSS